MNKLKLLGGYSSSHGPWALPPIADHTARFLGDNQRMRVASLALVLCVAGPALADPRAAATTPPQLSAFMFVDVPPPPPPSLRVEAARVVGENFQNSWRYPEPGTLGGVDGGSWFLGNGKYRPRTRRSAALHGASIGATLVGEILIGSGSPLAGVGALLTGATLDAAAADADRDSEAQRR